jgi:tetratricopeptide (TPR) repeat protein
LRAGFIWDDDAYVTNNQALRTFGGLGRIWLSPGATPQYYPLTFTSFWIEHQIFGDRPFGYHLTNVALHGLNAILVWLVLARLAMPGAWLAAAVFAVHPVHVESVAWITERKNLLSGALYLTALLLAVAPAGSPSIAERREHRWLVVAAFVGALLAKTVTCTLPVVLLLLLWGRHGRLTRRDVVATLPLFAVGCVLALVTIWMERSHVGARGAPWDLSPLARVLIAGRALWFYLATVLWPHPLSFVYPRWTIDPSTWWQWLFPLAAAAVALVLWLGRARFGRWPIVALAGFAVTLAPALGFVDVYPMRYTFVADHYQYLASLFVIVPAAVAPTYAAERRIAGMSPSTGLALAAVVVSALAVLTWRQTLVYADQEMLWRDVIATNPSASMAHINLGLWLHQEGRSRDALTALDDALRLEPGDAEIHGDLGIVLAALGRREDSRAHLEEAIRLAPASAQAHSNLGNALAAEGRLEEATAQYREAVRLAPAFADAQSNLANVLAQQGRIDEALAGYRAALAADPGFVAAHFNYAVVLSSAGRLDESVAEFRATIALDPRHLEAQRRLGALLAGRGRPGDAIPPLAAAAALQPDQADDHYRLAVTLAAAGHLAEAIASYRRALALRPDVADFHNDLGIALARRGDPAGAADEFRAALRLAPEHSEARANLATVTPGSSP